MVHAVFTLFNTVLLYVNILYIYFVITSCTFIFNFQFDSLLHWKTTAANFVHCTTNNNKRHSDKHVGYPPRNNHWFLSASSQRLFSIESVLYTLLEQAYQRSTFLVLV